MGNKINPIGYRISRFNNWYSKWNSDFKTYKTKLIENLILRNFLEKEVKEFSRIYIESARNFFLIKIFSSKPGIVIGKKGGNIKRIKFNLEKKFNKKFYIIIKDVISDIDVNSISRKICYYLEKRMNYRKIINNTINRIKKFLIRGLKIKVSGRLNGADIARKESFKLGKISLNCINEKVDFSEKFAETAYGKIGVKVWISY
ncbi:30S ribosomal protein S3 [Candidatus Vidania fulgoroideorum]